MTDITVVGAGFVGLAFAVAAGRQGYQVEVFDKKSRPGPISEPGSNVLAVNPASSRFLMEEDVWEKIPEKFRTPYFRMSVLDGDGTGSIEFSATDAGVDKLGDIVDQPALLEALVQRVEELPEVEIRWQTEADIEPGDVPLLVGADGVHSRIRENFRLRKAGFSYDQTATVCLVDVSKTHDACARQWFFADGPLALLPTGKANRVAMIWSSFEGKADIDDASMIVALAEATEGALGDILSVGPRFAFPLVQQQSLQYVDEGLALLGDAAHAIHPLAGQGANLGFADARELVSQISSSRLEGISPGSRTVLKRYEKARMPENHVTALAMEGFHRLFTARLPFASLLRSHGLRLFDGNKTLKQLAIGFASR